MLQVKIPHASTKTQLIKRKEGRELRLAKGTAEDCRGRGVERPRPTSCPPGRCRWGRGAVELALLRALTRALFLLDLPSRPLMCLERGSPVLSKDAWGGVTAS